MTYEEALKDINDTIKNKIKGLNDCYPNVIGRTICKCKEALEKQIPKKPGTKYGIVYYCPNDCGGAEFDEYGDILICPSCGKEDIEYNKYCPNCGQALDWSDER